jgi:hypothetical protein
VSNGTYTVVLHFAEIYWTTVGSRLFDVTIEGNKVLDNYDIFQKVGANTATKETFTVNVTDGMLNINFSAAVTDGGKDRPKVSAIEILSGSSARLITNVPAVSEPVLQSVTNLPVKAWPNPSVSGQFAITAGTLQGEINYSLFSSSGALLKRGKLTDQPASVLFLDFSREMLVTGVYHLHLTANNQKAVLKLIKE